MNDSTIEEPLTYQDLAATIEAELFDPLPAGLIEPAWLELPEIEASWLQMPAIEPEWLELPEIEPEWLAGLEQKHLEIEQEQREIEMEIEDLTEEQDFGDLEW